MLFQKVGYLVFNMIRNGKSLLLFILGIMTCFEPASTWINQVVWWGWRWFNWVEVGMRLRVE